VAGGLFASGRLCAAYMVAVDSGCVCCVSQIFCGTSLLMGCCRRQVGAATDFFFLGGRELARGVDASGELTLWRLHVSWVSARVQFCDRLYRRWSFVRKAF